LVVRRFDRSTTIKATLAAVDEVSAMLARK
jgi:hypothetical protein